MQAPVDALRPTVVLVCVARLPHLRRDWARPLATSAPGPDSPLPHLRRDGTHRCHICAGTGLTAATSAPGPGSPLPHLRPDRTHRCHICTGTGLTAATSAPGPGRKSLVCGHQRFGLPMRMRGLREGLARSGAT